MPAGQISAWLWDQAWSLLLDLSVPEQAFDQLPDLSRSAVCLSVTAERPPLVMAGRFEFPANLLAELDHFLQTPLKVGQQPVSVLSAFALLFQEADKGSAARVLNEHAQAGLFKMARRWLAVGIAVGYDQSYHSVPRQAA